MLLAHTFVQKIRIMANKVTDMSKKKNLNYPITTTSEGKTITNKLKPNTYE